jgi:hypothetical protein
LSFASIGPRSRVRRVVMLWDGQSHGTLMNVLRLAHRHKPVGVYVHPRKVFVDVRGQHDISALLAELDLRHRAA